MADGARYPRALFLGASVVSFALLMGDAAVAQTADTQETGRPSERKKQAKRKPAKPQAEQQAAAPVLNAYAQIGRAPVQSLDTITVAASKTEERAIDALAPVSVVTLEQIQGLQPNRLVRHLLQRARRVVPGSRRRSVHRHQHPRPAGFRPRRGRGRRRAAELSAHRPQSPTARSSSIPNWSAASMSCAARPRTSTAPARSAAWSRSAPRTSTTSCARASAGASIHDRLLRHQQRPRPRLDLRRRARQSQCRYVCGGAVYRTQGNYKDGTGTEIGNTGNDIASGLLKLTVRPADGHEVKFGTMFQDYKYSIGQPQPRPAIPIRPAPTAPTSARHLDLCVRCEELHDHAQLEILEAGRQLVRLGRDGLLATGSRTTRSRPTHRSRPAAAYCARQSRQSTSPAVSATSAAICSTRSASTSTTPRVSMSATGATR